MKIFYTFLFLISILFFSACADVGYVSNEPAYIEVGRPRQPSAAYIWIGGDWIWQRESNSYRRNEGHWDLPRRGRSYNQGYWESKPRGKRWVSGKWHK